MAATATDRIRARLAKAVEGWVFTPSDLLDLASPQLVGMTLLKMMRAGEVRRLARGIYDRPKHHPKLGALSPSPDAIAAAIARRDGSLVEPSEAVAANLLHLTEQVPARPEFQTDGRSRRVAVGGMTLRLRKRSRRKIGSIAPSSSLVFAGLRSIGRRHVTSDRVRHLRELLTAKERKALLTDLKKAPRWMHPFLREIAEVKTRTAKTLRKAQR